MTLVVVILALWAGAISPARDAWSQKSSPTLRLGVAGISGTNAHYYVDKQLGLGFNDLIDLSESGVAYALQQIVARKEFIERQPDLVMRFLRGLIEGFGYWKDPSKKVVVTENVARFLKLDTQKDREQLDETFRYYGKLFSTKPYPTLEGLELAAQIFKKARPDVKELQPKDYVVNRFIGELEKEGFLARVFGNR